MTVATAIASGRPTMVVISTPVYCVSQFCDPITDLVPLLAGEHQDRMNFVHIEVWRDFEAKTVNKAAAEWILPPGAQDATVRSRAESRMALWSAAGSTPRR